MKKEASQGSFPAATMRSSPMRSSPRILHESIERDDALTKMMTESHQVLKQVRKAKQSRTQRASFKVERAKRHAMLEKFVQEQVKIDIND